MKFLAPIALAVIGTEVAALNLKPKATHVAKTHRAHPVKEVNPLQLSMKKALQKISKAGSGPEPVQAKVITLVAFVSSLAMKFFPAWFPTLYSGYTPTKGADAAYTFLGKVDKKEQYLGYAMYAGILFDIAGIVINFTYEGGAKSGKNGVNDLSSWGNEHFWEVISFVLLPGIDSIVSSFIKGSTLADLTATPRTPDGVVFSGNADVGNYGAARGSLLKLFSMTGLENSWAFIVHEMIDVAVLGLGLALTYTYSLVFNQHGWNAGTVPLFWAFMGIGLTTGWYMLDATAVLPEMVLALTKNSDSGNFWASISTLLPYLVVIGSMFIPVFDGNLLGTYQLTPLYLGIAFYMSWAAMRPYNVPDTLNVNANWQKYIKGPMAPPAPTHFTLPLGFPGAPALSNRLCPLS